MLRRYLSRHSFVEAGLRTLSPRPSISQPSAGPVRHLPALGRVFLWRRRVATIAVSALALVMAYGVVFGHNGLTAFAHKRQEARILNQQRLELERENDRLRGHVDRLQSDPGAIEHEAREDLHYTRAGEVIYTLPKPAAQAPVVPPSQPTQE